MNRQSEPENSNDDIMSMMQTIDGRMKKVEKRINQLSWSPLGFLVGTAIGWWLGGLFQEVSLGYLLQNRLQQSLLKVEYTPTLGLDYKLQGERRRSPFIYAWDGFHLGN